MQIDVSPGDVLDRLTILEIKLERISDPAKRAFAQREFDMLTAVLATRPDSGDWAALRQELKAVNLTLWQVEDDLREHERRGDFGPAFIALARSVYRHNDRRAALKAAINAQAGSPLNDVKSYAPY